MVKFKDGKGRMVSIQFPVVIFREGKWIIAHCPLIDVASQGRTVEEAKKNVAEAIALYMEDEDTYKPKRQDIELSISMISVNIEKRSEHQGHHHEVACPVST